MYIYIERWQAPAARRLLNISGTEGSWRLDSQCLETHSSNPHTLSFTRTSLAKTLTRHRYMTGTRFLSRFIRGRAGPLKKFETMFHRQVEKAPCFKQRDTVVRWVRGSCWKKMMPRGPQGIRESWRPSMNSFLYAIPYSKYIDIHIFVCVCVCSSSHCKSRQTFLSLATSAWFRYTLPI